MLRKHLYLLLLQAIAVCNIGCASTPHSDNTQSKDTEFKNHESKNSMEEQSPPTPLEFLNPDYPKYAQIVAAAREHFAAFDYIQQDVQRIKLYVIEPIIVADEKTYSVIFKHKDTPKRMRGSLPGKPNFTVSLDKKTFALINITQNR